MNVFLQDPVNSAYFASRGRWIFNRQDALSFPSTRLARRQCRSANLKNVRLVVYHSEANPPYDILIPLQEPVALPDIPPMRFINLVDVDGKRHVVNPIYIIAIHESDAGCVVHLRGRDTLPIALMETVEVMSNAIDSCKVDPPAIGRP